MIRFLFDECLSPRLIGVAHSRGYDASHVAHQGLVGFSDRMLLPQIIGGDFTFVTNNRRDFLRLYRTLDMHAGLLIIVPAAKRDNQIAMFLAALEEIERRSPDLVNQLVEVDADGTVTFTTYPFDRIDG